MVSEHVGVRRKRQLLNPCMRAGKMPEEWRTVLIVPVWKRKGDDHDLGKYQVITMLYHVLKVLERIMGGRIVYSEMGELQQGFRRGRNMADGTLRQLVEVGLEGQENKGLIDHEKAYDTVPRETAVGKLRWKGIQEEEVKMAEDTKEKTKGIVVSETGISDDFRVAFDLKQGSALSILLFIAVVEVIIRTASARDNSPPVDPCR